MKYSLMSLMVDTELKLEKPNFIHMAILNDMGYEGKDPTIDEVFEYLNAHGVPMKNGTMTFEDLVKLAKDCGYDGLDLMSFHFEIPGAEAKKILERYGIVLSAVNLIMPFANASTEEKFTVMLSRAKAAIDQACEAGCHKASDAVCLYTGRRNYHGTILPLFYQRIKGVRCLWEIQRRDDQYRDIGIHRGVLLYLRRNEAYF